VTTHKNRISIIIPAKNEEKTIGLCLDAIMSQRGPEITEVVIIDSGSTDETCAIAARYEKVRLITIRPEEFGHGKTRNLGAGLAQGEILIFLNADAIPQDDYWLDRLVLELNREKKIAGVYSRHLPREGCHLYMARDLEKAMPAFRIEKTRTDPLDFFQFSTVSAAIRKEIWVCYPFQDEIPIAEDQEWAERVLQAGYKLVYTPDSSVLHSHNYSSREMFHLKKRVGQVVNPFPNRISAIFLGPFLSLGGIIVKCCADYAYIMKLGLPLIGKIREMITSLKARTSGFAGHYAGWVTKSHPQ